MLALSSFSPSPLIADRLCFMGIDEVYARVDPQPVIGIMTRWFCGQDPICKVADPQPLEARRLALKRAMDNLRDEYIWVGVLER